MKIGPEYRYEMYRDWKPLRYISVSRDTLFKHSRDSDIKDTRKILGIRIVPKLTEDEVYTKIYHNFEDAMRSHYHEGCEIYETVSGDIRVRHADDSLYAFYRIDNNLLPIIEEISLLRFISKPEFMSIDIFKSSRKVRL